MTSTGYGVGAVSPGEGYLIIRPSGWVPPASRVGVLYCHGAGGSALEPMVWTSIRAITNELAAQNFTVLACDLGGVGTWGNDTALARITAAQTYLQGTLGCRPGKIGLLGLSMGGGASLAWAAANPSSTAFVLAAIPVCNLTDLWNKHTDGGGIDAAYAGGYTEAVYGATHNATTMALAGKYATVPISTLYASTDAITAPAVHEAFVAASGATSFLATGGHNDASVGQWDVPGIVAWARSKAGT